MKFNEGLYTGLYYAKFNEGLYTELYYAKFNGCLHGVVLCEI